MSTLRGTVGGLYNTNENRFRYYARATYAAFYPIVELEYTNGARRTALVTTEGLETEPFDQSWQEEVMSGGIRIPLRLTQGTHTTTLTVEGRYEYFKVGELDTAGTKTILEETEFTALRSEIIFSRLKMRAPQQVNSPWGQVLEGSFRKSSDGQSIRMQLNALLYFPGLFPTHSLNFRSSYKKEKTINAYRFEDDFIMPRGYAPYPFEKIGLGSVNYQLPVLYPDLSLGSIAFIQRLRWNVFYDHAVGVLNQRNSIMSAPGTELYADLRLFRLFQMTLCFRYNLATQSTAYPSPETIPFQFLVTRFELMN
jgi:hypothetical protein